MDAAKTTTAATTSTTRAATTATTTITMHYVVHDGDDGDGPLTRAFIFGARKAVFSGMGWLGGSCAEAEGRAEDDSELSVPFWVRRSFIYGVYVFRGLHRTAGPRPPTSGPLALAGRSFRNAPPRPWTPAGATWCIPRASPRPRAGRQG